MSTNDCCPTAAQAVVASQARLLPRTPIGGGQKSKSVGRAGVKVEKAGQQSRRPERPDDCPGDPPFVNTGQHCCDLHDELETRRLIEGRSDGRRIASRAGVHPADFTAFVSGRLTLTPENRRQIRAHCRGGT